MLAPDQDAFQAGDCSIPGLATGLTVTVRENGKASYYRARYYDPEAGRFMSEDLLRFDSGGPNLYLYAGNSPTDLVDPLGLWPITDPIGWINGASDMWNNYERMKQRNWKGDDLYYHCMANCQATNEGPFNGGAGAAYWISLGRTLYGMLFEPDWRNDVKANKCGQQGGDCNKRCAPFAPKSSPGKPPFPGW